MVSRKDWCSNRYDDWLLLLVFRLKDTIVDAAMRQLNEIGYMHNRCRMIVASFLAKDLLLDWRMGEKYFMLVSI